MVGKDGLGEGKYLKNWPRGPSFFFDVACVCKHPQSIFKVLGVKIEEVHRD